MWQKAKILPPPEGLYDVAVVPRHLIGEEVWCRPHRSPAGEKRDALTGQYLISPSGSVQTHLQSPCGQYLLTIDAAMLEFTADFCIDAPLRPFREWAEENK